MVEVRNGRVRVTPDELVNSPWSGALGRLKPAVPDDGYLYLITNPMDQDPWVEFNAGGHVQVKPVLPPGFVGIYGERPTGAAGTSQLQGLQGEWDRQLGLWRDNKPPDSVTPEQYAVVEALCLAHSMGRLLPFRLTNGYAGLCFPDANLAGRRSELPIHLEMGAEFVFAFPAQAIASYQLAAMNEGAEIPNDQLVGFARRSHR